MKFWQNHAQEMRKARLLQAAAVMFATNPNMSESYAIDRAFDLESKIAKRLEKEQNGYPEKTVSR